MIYAQAIYIIGNSKKHSSRDIGQVKC